MTSIVIEDLSNGTMQIYNPKYPAQRSLFEQKKTERILVCMDEIKYLGNVNIYLWKKRKLRKIATRKM